MKKKHPRLAAAIFFVFYFLIGLLISGIFKVKLYESKIFICVGAGIVLIISIILGNQYYDAILEEKKQEEEFFNKINKNLEDNLKNDKNE